MEREEFSGLREISTWRTPRQRLRRRRHQSKEETSARPLRRVSEVNSKRTAPIQFCLNFPPSCFHCEPHQPYAISHRSDGPGAAAAVERRGNRWPRRFHRVRNLDSFQSLNTFYVSTYVFVFSARNRQQRQSRSSGGGGGNTALPYFGERPPRQQQLRGKLHSGVGAAAAGSSGKSGRADFAGGGGGGGQGKKRENWKNTRSAKTAAATDQQESRVIRVFIRLKFIYSP